MLFELTVSEDFRHRIAIDEKNSRFCGGNYVDGSWGHANPGCEDSVQYKTIRTPSGYVTLKVEPFARAVKSRWAAGRRGATARAKTLRAGDLPDRRPFCFRPLF